MTQKATPELHAAKLAKLDPKRAKHFNEMGTSEFYDQGEARHNASGVPVWSRDE